MTTTEPDQWAPDLLPGYQSRQLELPDAELLAEEEPGSVRATLIRRDGRRLDKAVLYVHGWNDYFFQTHLGDFFAGLGYDFYAVDLRRYGRSLSDGQVHGYISSLDEYEQELDQAVAIINAEAPDGGRRKQLILSGHSTGGLITSLWVADHPGIADGLVLNSPWFDLQGSAIVRAVGTPVIDTLARRGLSTTPIPMAANDLYARTLRADQDGEWEYDLDWKLAPGAPVLIGWVRAIRQGHARIAAGLGIQIPVLVMASARSVFRSRWHEDVKTADTVLDVEQIARRAPKIGRRVTIVRFDGGLHDLVLSPEPVRHRVFAEMRVWLDYVTLSPTE